MKNITSDRRKKTWTIIAMCFGLLVVFANAQTARAQMAGPDSNNNIYYNAGNVGIGTTSPGALLHLNATGAAIARLGSGTTTNDYGRLELFGKASSDGVSVGYLPFYNTRSGSAVLVTSFDVFKEGSGSDDKAAIAISTHNGSSLAERIRISSVGNIGIGTTSPRGKLEVSTAGSVGSVVVGSPNDLSTGTVIIGTSSGGQALSLTDSVNAHTYLEFSSSAPSGSRIRSDSNLTLQSAAGGLMTLSSGGSVGIGTTSPRGKLEVSTTGSVGSVVVGSPNDLSTGTVIIGTSSGGQALSLTDSVNAHTYLEFSSSAPSGSRIRSDSNLTLQSAAGGLMTLSSGGSVGIGTTSPSEKLEVSGNLRVSAIGSVPGNITAAGTIEAGNIKAKYQDVAEWVPSSEKLSAGTVVVLDSAKSNQVTSSTVSYDTRVAGVVSIQPGIALGEKSDGKVLVATTGRVRVKVDATKGPIHIGDLLVTSDVPGVAMKSEPVNLGGVQFHRPGTLIGKALEPWEKGKGEILVLLSLQ
jgi:hypothetical protein